MLSLRLARGTRPVVLGRRLLVACSSAGAGFLLLAALSHASAAELLWCAVPVLAAVRFAVAVARTDPYARPAPGLSDAGLGPATVPTLAAVTTAISCLLGSALALLLFLQLRGDLGGLPFDGAAAGPLAGDMPLPTAGVLTLLVCVPAVAAAASAASLWPRPELPGDEGEDDDTAPPRRVPAGTPLAPSGVPWGVALVAVGLMLGAYASRPDAAGGSLRLPLPAGPGHTSPAVLAGWAAMAFGLVVAGPGITHLCGRLLALLRPGVLRLLAGRVLQEEARRIGRAVGALCAVLAGGIVAVTLAGPGTGPAATEHRPGTLTAMGVVLVVGCAAATMAMTALETRNARRGANEALTRLGAPPGTQRNAAALRAGALAAVFGPLAALIADLAMLPLHG